MTTNLTDADILANYTDDEIESLLKDRAANRYAIALAQSSLHRALMADDETESMINQWVMDLRREIQNNP